MTKITKKEQYEWAVKKVERLLNLVTDTTPPEDPNRIELELLSNLVADYSEEHFATQKKLLTCIWKRIPILVKPSKGISLWNSK